MKSIRNLKGSARGSSVGWQSVCSGFNSKESNTLLTYAGSSFQLCDLSFRFPYIWAPFLLVWARSPLVRVLPWVLSLPHKFKANLKVHGRPSGYTTCVCSWYRVEMSVRGWLSYDLNYMRCTHFPFPFIHLPTIWIPVLPCIKKEWFYLIQCLQRQHLRSYQCNH